jgi:hypothetical protein
MKNSQALTIVSILAGLLAAVQSGVGLFYQDGGSPFNFTTLHGQTVQIYGQGLYHFDTYFKAPIARGTDAVTLFLCVPLLAIAIFLYGRGSLRGGILLTGVITYLAYNSASVALGTAYNNLILVYIAYFSASLFAFVLAIAQVDHQALAARLASGLPHRGTAVVLGAGGLAVFFAWLTDILSALLAGNVPDIASYTTEVTYVLDLGIIAPVSFLAVVLLLRRAPVSYLMASLLLTALTIVGVDVLFQTIFQVQAGIFLSPGMLVGKAGSFAVLSLFAIWMLVRFYASLGGKQLSNPSTLKPARN